LTAIPISRYLFLSVKQEEIYFDRDKKDDKTRRQNKNKTTTRQDKKKTIKNKTTTRRQKQDKNKTTEDKNKTKTRRQKQDKNKTTAPPPPMLIPSRRPWEVVNEKLIGKLSGPEKVCIFKCLGLDSRHF
jgi:hypothetical protein